jgi:hypothetical protein
MDGRVMQMRDGSKLSVPGRWWRQDCARVMSESVECYRAPNLQTLGILFNRGVSRAAEMEFELPRCAC